MLSVRLNRELESLLDQLSQSRGLSKSAIIKDALVQYFRKEGEKISPYEVGADLFGVTGGPVDASANYKVILKKKRSAKYSH